MIIATLYYPDVTTEQLTQTLAGLTNDASIALKIQNFWQIQKFSGPHPVLLCVAAYDKEQGLIVQVSMGNAQSIDKSIKKSLGR